MRVICLAALVVMFASLAPVAPRAVLAQDRGGVALAGAVTSRQEGPMEGVVVTARRDGANFSVSVVTDARGRYAFPRENLEPGRYGVRLRAVGYDADEPGPVTVKAGGASTFNLRLHPTANLSAQLTSLEWVMSMPGTPEQKNLLVRRTVNCAFCHSLERVVRTRYTAEQWIPVIQRMGTYNPDFTGLLRHQVNAPATGGEAPAPAPVTAQTKELASYLATVNLSTASIWGYALQTLPRPKGRATRVVVTVYDLPRRDSVVHDMDVDAQGNAWFGNTGWDFLGKLDPKTATFSEYAAPNFLPRQPPAIQGVADVQVDAGDNVWAAVRGPRLGRFDTRTLTWTFFDLPGGKVAVNFIAPFAGRDAGVVWATETANAYRVNTRTGVVDAFPMYTNAPPGSHLTYAIDMDSKNNAYFEDFGSSNIGRIDNATGAVTLIPTPTPNAFPRRGSMDAQDRLWFSEFLADKIGRLDTATGRIDEFPVPRLYISPYFVRPDSRGDIWSSSLGSDRLLRMNPATGEFAEYLMPVYYDARKVVLDRSSRTTTLWLPNKNSSQLIRVQPLD